MVCALTIAASQTLSALHPVCLVCGIKQISMIGYIEPMSSQNYETCFSSYIALSGTIVKIECRKVKTPLEMMLCLRLKFPNELATYNLSPHYSSSHLRLVCLSNKSGCSGLCLLHHLTQFLFMLALRKDDRMNVEHVLGRYRRSSRPKPRRSSCSKDPHMTCLLLIIVSSLMTIRT